MLICEDISPPHSSGVIQGGKKVCEVLERNPLAIIYINII